MEYWPLIKLVRIFCKAPAFDNGAVLVDLPGLQDSNAARAKITDNYLKECTAVVSGHYTWKSIVFLLLTSVVCPVGHRRYPASG